MIDNSALLFIGSMTEEINKFSVERPGKDRGKTGERPGNGKIYEGTI